MKLIFENWNRFLVEQQKDPLLEGRKDDVIQKFGEKVSQEALQLIIDADEPNKYKHLRWMAKQLSRIDSPEKQTEEAKRLTQGIEDFVDNKQLMKKKSIDQYKSVDDLLDSVYQDVVMSRVKRARKKRSDNRTTDVLIDNMDAYHVYEDDRFFVIKPDTLEASCYFGRKTKWCIAQPGNSEWYRMKEQDGVTFYFIKDDTKKEDEYNAKIAVEVTGEGAPFFDKVWDRNDDDREIASDDVNDLAKTLEGLEVPPQTAMAIAMEISDDYTFGSDIIMSFYEVARDYDDFMYALESNTKMADAMINIAASFHETHPKILEYLAGQNLDVDIKRKLAKNRNASKKVLRWMLRDEDLQVKAGAVENKNIDPKELMTIAKDKNAEELHNVMARIPNLPEEMLKLIMSHRNYSTLKILSSDDKTPPEVLIQMASVVHGWDAADFAGRPDLPPAALEVLANRFKGDTNQWGRYDDLRGEIRISIVQHPNTTSRAIAKLVKSDPELKKFVRDSNISENNL